MLTRLIAVLFLIFMMLSSAVFFVGAVLIWLVTVLFDKRRVVLHYYTCFWGSLYLWVVPFFQISIQGKENLNYKKNYVIVSNHQSLLDILIAFRLFFPFKWISKAEIFRLPFIGWNMYLNDYIKINRGNKQSAANLYAAAKKHLNNGCSVYFFPEGTRSHDGQLKEFKLGAFKLASELQLPVLPVVIEGTQNALPKKSLNFHGKHRIVIHILPEVTYEETKHLSVEQLTDHVRTIIDKEVQKNIG